MKFLLVGINAKYIHSNPAIYSLCAYAGQFTDGDHHPLSDYVGLCEYTINQNVEEILADIYEQEPSVVAFSCYIWNITMVNRIVGELHKIMPQLPIWLGGPEVSYEPDKEMQQRPYLTGIMIGEGEKTFTQLLLYYLNNCSGSLESIHGIYTEAGFTTEQTCVELDTIPFFYRNPEDFKNRIIYYESSRGCPFRCSYCLSSIDKKMRFRSFSLVKEELLFFLEHKVEQVKFIDRTFNANHEHALGIWKLLKEHDNGITNFHFEIAADILSREELELLVTLRPGLVQLEIGVQSTNEVTIDAIKRSMNLDKLEYAVNRINRAQNIHQHLDLIAGLPYEDYESFHKSFNHVYQMRPHQLQLGFLKVLKGSRMYAEAEKFGIVCQSEPPYEVLFTNWLSYKDVIRLKKVEAMVELFYNSNQFCNTMQMMVYLSGDAFELYEKLAEFFERNGYFTMSVRRMYYYEIILSYAEQYLPDYRELIQESLIYDCYLRENMKSRPEFAPCQDSKKDAIREIYSFAISEGLLYQYEGYDRKQVIRMTHLEFFRYPVWKENPEDKMRKMKNRIPVIFQYEKRNPLTLNGEIIILTERGNYERQTDKGDTGNTGS